MTRLTPSSQYSRPKAGAFLHGSQSAHGVGVGSGSGTGSSSVFLFLGDFAMIRFTLFSFVSCVCLGCGPGSPTKNVLVYPIAASQLASIYRHNPRDRTWQDCHVKCRLEPGTYTCFPDRIEAHCVNDSGCVWFVTNAGPRDTLATLTIVGVCKGITRDGRWREPGVDYYVNVEVVSIDSER